MLINPRQQRADIVLKKFWMGHYPPSPLEKSFQEHAGKLGAKKGHKATKPGS